MCTQDLGNGTSQLVACGLKGQTITQRPGFKQLTTRLPVDVAARCARFTVLYTRGTPKTLGLVCLVCGHAGLTLCIGSRWCALWASAGDANSGCDRPDAQEVVALCRYYVVVDSAKGASVGTEHYYGDGYTISMAFEGVAAPRESQAAPSVGI